MVPKHLRKKQLFFSPQVSTCVLRKLDFLVRDPQRQTQTGALALTVWILPSGCSLCSFNTRLGESESFVTLFPDQSMDLSLSIYSTSCLGSLRPLLSSFLLRYPQNLHLGHWFWDKSWLETAIRGIREQSSWTISLQSNSVFYPSFLSPRAAGNLNFLSDLRNE